jgi:hypothetical protein
MNIARPLFVDRNVSDIARAAEATDVRRRCCQTTRPEPSIETSVALTRGGASLGGTTDEFSAIT